MSNLTANSCLRCGGELRFDPAGEIIGCSSGCALFLIRPSANGEGPVTRTAELLAGAEPVGLGSLPLPNNRATLQPPRLAHEPAILDVFARDLGKCGLVGEDRAAKLVFLAAVSRLHDRPVSVVLKGPSSGGKSFTVETVLAFFPEHAYHALTGGSERALAYSQEPLKHRMLVIYEAAGITGDLPSYFLRSLLSEGRLRYETVESTAEGIKSKLIEREGPTGLIVTTTAVKLHPENETRLLSIPVNDTPEQTRQVLRALADEDEQLRPDLLPWLTLQDWLAAGECEVSIPFAARLAELIPPVAVRLRRDFSTVLGLVRAHALLHRASRATDNAGRIVATLDDYAVVRELLLELVSDGVGATVCKETRETVEAVEALKGRHENGVPQRAIVQRLKVDKSAISRRVRVALEAGYLVNMEERRGRLHRLEVGEPLPDEVEILPAPDALDSSCTVAQLPGGERGSS
jgi:hypothetical protein